MSVRKWVYEKVLLVPGMGVFGGRFYSSGAVGEAVPGDSPARPFGVIRFSPGQPGVLPTYPVNQRNFKIWLHDEPGTMSNIEDGCEALRKAMPGFAPELFMGNRIICCEWAGVSEDSYDDHFGTNTVWSDFRLTWKPAP